MKLLLLLLPALLFASPLVDMVKKHEGYSNKPYRDTIRNYSIGYGINLSHGITEYEAELILVHRLGKLTAVFEQHNWFNQLTPNRKLVVLSMAYQLGTTGFYQFKHFIWRLKQGYYNSAANAMEQSLWYKQSGNRSRELVHLMRKG